MVIPTLGTDHQFDLDYTVAHLAALLDLVSPDAIIIDDYTRWLQNGCLWNLDLPENHVALAWALEHSVLVMGISLSPSDSAFPRIQRTLLEFRGEYPDIPSVREDAQLRLNQAAARIACEYSFADEPQSLAHLLSAGFRERASTWSASQRQSIEQYAARVLDSIRSHVAAHPDVDRWTVILNWPAPQLVANGLNRSGYRICPVQGFLPALDTAVLRRMDVKHVSWILAGRLEEWCGMRVPQAFNGARIAEHLRVLRELASDSPVYGFLEACWLMRNRDFLAAQARLEALIS